MEGLRVLLAISFFGLAGLGAYLFSFESGGVSVSGAVLAPVADHFVLTARIENSGPPDRLVAVASDTARAARLVGSGPDGATIPSASAPVLSQNGVYGELSGLIGDTANGRLVPVTFWFERAGKISVRAEISGPAVARAPPLVVPAGDPMPDIYVAAQPDNGGWVLSVITSNFSFSKNGADGPHQPGSGFGRLFVDGLELGQIHGPETDIGALPPGRHRLRVALSSNDNRAYEVGGAPIAASTDVIVK